MSALYLKLGIALALGIGVTMGLLKNDYVFWLCMAVIWLVSALVLGLTNVWGWGE